MEFGILFTSQPNLELDEYPYTGLRARLTGDILHYPPYYGPEPITRSLTLIAEDVMPRFRDPSAARGAAE
jgi:hypothetical protein